MYWNIWVRGKITNAAGQFRSWSKAQLYAKTTIEAHAQALASHVRSQHATWEVIVLYKGSKPSWKTTDKGTN